MSSANPSATALSEGARVEGDLVLNHDATIAGEITGDLRCAGRVELTSTARVYGVVQADTVRVAGRIDGGVTATRLVELLAGAQIAGGITAARLSVAEGVAYDGGLRLTDGETQAVTAPPKPTMTLTRNRAAQGSTTAAAEPAAFPEVPGATHAGLRPRRRVPLPSVI